MKTALFLVFLVLNSSCVTTRAQLQDRNQPSSNSAGHPTGHPAAVKDTASEYSFEDLKNEVSRLLGRVDEVEHRLNDMGENSGAFKALQSQMDDLTKKLEKMERAAATPTPAPEQDYFAVGKELMKAQQYDEAANAFTAAQKNAESKKLEEAIMLAGEAHFKAKHHRKAIVEFSKIQDQFPKSNQQPKALLRIAESF